jgi:hypothetical protein
MSVDSLVLLGSPEGYVLSLVGVVCHVGSNLSSGHYICYFKAGYHWIMHDDMARYSRLLICPSPRIKHEEERDVVAAAGKDGCMDFCKL